MKLVKQIKQIKLVEQMKQATSHLTITILNRRDLIELSSEVDMESDYNNCSDESEQKIKNHG